MQRLLFVSKIDFEVDISRLNAFMTEPERNDGDVDTRLQQMQSRCMPLMPRAALEA